MKLELPNRSKIELDENISIEEKLRIVDELVEAWLPYLNPKLEARTFFLDGLANYLVWHKDEESKGKEDKEVLSIKKIEEMVGKRKGKSIPFTSISKIQKEMLFGEPDVRGAE